ncbi:sensory rhodopsin transducer [Halalkalibacter kiskunsagensis]|uniref:Sensory rhodopsin transducer n=1 Tax=Halalkalibacter kiskunsagensis TaxID=1548599 RepID=A0ABV6KFR9_9BACI
MNKYGSTTWFIPDGFIPKKSSGELESHEAICLLNSSKETAEITVTVYFEEDEPIKDIRFQVKGERTKHIRTDYLVGKDEKKILRGVPYALKVESSLPVIVQFSRMDATQSANTLMTTMAYAINESY